MGTGHLVYYEASMFVRASIKESALLCRAAETRRHEDG